MQELAENTPTQSPENVAAGITVSRFHEALFALADDRQCVPMPVGVGRDRLDEPSNLVDCVQL